MIIWFNLKLVSACRCHGSKEHFTKKKRLSYDFSFKSIVTFFKSPYLGSFRDFLQNMQISNQIISKSKSWRYFHKKVSNLLFNISCRLILSQYICFTRYHVVKSSSNNKVFRNAIIIALLVNNVITITIYII